MDEDFDDIKLCSKCTIPLTEDEIYYYGDVCNDCEREWMEAVERWLSGEDNCEFDVLYGDTKLLQEEEDFL